jgi:glutaminyl-peptide cyclotransferase
MEHDEAKFHHPMPRALRARLERPDATGHEPPMIAALLALLLAVPVSATAPAPVQTARVVATYKHDRTAFTEGLFYLDGRIYESTGLNGQSELREVDLAEGKVLRSVRIPARYFGEGIVNWGPEIISLTWQDGIGFRWRRSDFAKLGEFRYPGEGWALTQNGRDIIMSDGTATLRFLDPRTLKVRRLLKVTDDGVPVPRLNELEWVKGEIYANVWLTSLIVRIDPVSGRVKGWIDLADLAAANMGGNSDNVLNGIAYDAARDRLFVTGKNWPRLYQIDLVPAKR